MFLMKPVDFFKFGYKAITSEEELHHNTRMDFGILNLRVNSSFKIKTEKEHAFLLLDGMVVFQFEEGEIQAKRGSLVEEGPTCLHVPKGVLVKISTLSNAEIAVIATTNANSFESVCYSSTDVYDEYRGYGTMQETSTRIVRTIFDKTKSPSSNLVVGEVINFPGKWSSYPPHHHPQPEIYHYRFFPRQGFGFAMLGDEVVKVTDGCTLKIVNDLSHPQVSAPGYTMYYLWAIRHIENNPYTAPIFEPEHIWVMSKDA